MSTLGLVLAGGKGSQLSVLTEQRAKPALPVGGSYCLIDFALSNLANSQIESIAVLAQFQTQTLSEHIGDGQVWSKAGIPLWMAGVERTGLPAYRGTADAVFQNRKFIAASGCDRVLIVAGDHLYRQDYRDMIRFHTEKGAAFTLSYIEVEPAQREKFGMVRVDANQKIVMFDEKPAVTDAVIGSMGIYVFNTTYLLDLLETTIGADPGAVDFGQHIIPRIVAAGQAYAFPHSGGWADVGQVQDYWQTNLALLEKRPPFPLDDPAWPLLAPAEARAPARVRMEGHAADCLLSAGCVVEGEVVSSVLAPGVVVERGAVVRRSVILRDAVIRAGAQVEDCVLDERSEVGVNAKVGGGDDQTPNQAQPQLLFAGISLIGADARIPAGAVIGPNCLIAPGARPENFEGLELASGMTVNRFNSVE